MGRTSSKRKRPISKGRLGKNVGKFDCPKHTGMSDFRRVCMDAVQQAPMELTQESKDKGAAFLETGTASTSKGTELGEYKVIYEHGNFPETVSVPTVGKQRRRERDVLIVLFLLTVIYICGWLCTYAVFRKALQSSTQEKIELQEKLRQYEYRQPQS